MERGISEATNQRKDEASPLRGGVGVSRTVSLGEMLETKCLSPRVLAKHICQPEVFKCL